MAYLATFIYPLITLNICQKSNAGYAQVHTKQKWTHTLRRGILSNSLYWNVCKDAIFKWQRIDLTTHVMWTSFMKSAQISFFWKGTSVYTPLILVTILAGYILHRASICTFSKVKYYYKLYRAGKYRIFIGAATVSSEFESKVFMVCGKSACIISKFQSDFVQEKS